MESFRKLVTETQKLLNPETHDSRNTSAIAHLERLSSANPSFSSLVSLLSELQQYDVSKELKIGFLRASGGYADVYDGQLFVGYPSSANGVRKDGKNGERRGGRRSSLGFTKVAVKRFRAFLSADKDFARAIARELRVWASLDHPNVLPLLGFTVVDSLPSFVSEWMEHGTVRQYLAKQPGANVMRMAKEIADGLTYLHANGVVHSDLKSDNILVDLDGHLVLSDFGVSRLLIESVTVAGTSSLKGNARWMAIELIDSRASASDKHQFHTKATDVWAYGMVVYELLSGKIPFHDLVSEVNVILAIISDRLPSKPTKEECGDAKSDDIWSICVRCWAKNPAERPTVSELLDELKQKAPSVKLTPIDNFSAHSDWVISVAFSPDGHFLATASMDHTICIWSLNKADSTTLRYRPLLGHKNWVRSVAWSHNGSFVVSGSWDNTVRKWDAKSGKCLMVTEAKHTKGIWTVVFSPDDRRIVSGGADNSVYVWDAFLGIAVAGPFTGHTDGVRSVAYSPDGRHIVSASGDRSIIVWDSTSGAKLHGPITVHSNWVRSISYSPSGNKFVTGSSDQTFTIWDANSFTPIHRKLRAHEDQVNAMQYSPDGSFILSASTDGTLKVWDAKTGELASEAVVHGKSNANREGNGQEEHVSVRAAAFSPDGRRIASGGLDGKVMIWDVHKVESS